MNEGTTDRERTFDGSPEGPTRMCVLTRDRAPQNELLRLALGPEGQPFVDLLGRAPGRGVYVKADLEILDRAFSPKGIGRLFKGRAKALSDEARARLIEDTRDRLEARIVELLTLARRAGVLELGMDSVLGLIGRSNEALLLVTATDLSTRSVEKLAESVPGNHARVRISTKAVLGRAFGRESVGVLCVRPSVLKERVLSESKRLEGLTRDSD